MNRITTFLVEKNPVWAFPLALPIVFFGSQSLERALLFAAIIAIVLPTVHTISFFVESLLPRMLRIIPVLVIAGSVVTIVELFVFHLGVADTHRLTLMIRATSVSGIVIWPTIRSRPGERFIDRVEVVFGLLLGFLLGFALFSAIRLSLGALEIGIANSVALGFFILAVGRIVLSSRKVSKETNGAGR